jgi:hypothetical protein
MPWFGWEGLYSLGVSDGAWGEPPVWGLGWLSSNKQISLHSLRFDYRSIATLPTLSLHYLHFTTPSDYTNQHFLHFPTHLVHFLSGISPDGSPSISLHFPTLFCYTLTFATLPTLFATLTTLDYTFTTPTTLLYTLTTLFDTLTTLYYAFLWPNATLSVRYFRRLWPTPFATLGTFSLHSLRLTRIYYGYFATLAYTLVHFLHFWYTFWHQIRRKWYTIFVDSDLSLSYTIHRQRPWPILHFY